MRLIFTFLFILPLSQTNAQSIQWIRGIHGNQYQSVNDLTLDSHGNVLLIGSFTDTVDLDPGISTFNKVAVGGSNTFIVKLDPAGNLIWGQSIGGTGWDLPQNIHCDGNDNVYVSGIFQNTIDVDPGTSVHLIDSAQGNSFLLKLDSTGAFLWVRQCELVNQFIESFAIKNNNHILFLEQSFLKEIDENNNILSVDSIAENARKIILDDEENIFISGFFSSPIDLDPSVGQYILSCHSTSGFNDSYVEKFDSLKHFLWGTGISNPPPNVAISEMITDHSGNLFLAVKGNAGLCISTNVSDTCISLSGPQQSIPYLLKFNHSGDFIWSENVQGINSAAIAAAVCLATDQNNNVYFGGMYSNDSIDIDPGSNTFILTNSSLSNIFIQELDSACSFLGCLEYNGIMADPIKLACNQSNELYSTGHFWGPCAFDTSGNSTMYSTGNSDTYLVKHSSLLLNTLSFGEETDQFQIFPSPSSEEVNLTCLDRLPKTGKLIVLNCYGVVVYENDKVTIPENGTINIPIENLSKGIYTVIFTYVNHKSVLRFVKI